MGFIRNKRLENKVKWLRLINKIIIWLIIIVKRLGNLNFKVVKWFFKKYYKLKFVLK